MPDTQEDDLQAKLKTLHREGEERAAQRLADKKAVLKMVRLILNKSDLKVIDDASDALALAIFSAGERYS